MYENIVISRRQLRFTYFFAEVFSIIITTLIIIIIIIIKVIMTIKIIIAVVKILSTKSPTTLN